MIAEKLAKSYSRKPGFFVRVVRYGNVAGSRGSVIPAFQELINNGKKLTLTDREMTRFWITKTEAVSLILDAMRVDTFLQVPKLPSFRIVDLVKAMGGDCDSASITGVREGEKLHETMLLKEENNGVEYRSDTNPYFLSVAELRERLKKI